MISWRELKSINLLAIILIAVLAPPLIGIGVWSKAVMLGLGAAIGWAGYLLVGSGRWLRFYIFITACIVAVWGLGAAGVGGLWSDVGMEVLVALIAATTLYIVLRHALFGDNAHGLDRVIGAASGYFLIALLWSRFYLIILAFHPEAIRDGATGAAPDITSVLYFSLVTMTTLGYGDIAPVSPYARLVAAIQAGIGSLYLAIVVAALVGRLRGESSKAGG